MEENDRDKKKILLGWELARELRQQKTPDLSTRRSSAKTTVSVTLSRYEAISCLCITTGTKNVKKKANEYVVRMK